MSDPQSYRPAPGTIPTNPGVYRFIDGEGRVLYVGKAKNLRARLSNYFQDPSALIERIRTMVYTAEKVVWVVVGSEVEALTLEYSWIKEFDPPFNVVFRDNKSYPYLAVSVKEEFPRVWVTRQEHRAGVRYLGPYTKVWAIRDTLDKLLTVFPARSCTAGQFKQAQRMGRPCLFGDLGKCAAPCVGRISAENHREIVRNLMAFVDGDHRRAIAERTAEMKRAAAEQDFERAARLRDEAAALEAINERNVVVFDADLDADIFGVAHDDIEASVQVFYVRGGRIRGQQAWVSEETGGLSLPEIVADMVLQVYSDPKYDEQPAGRVGGTSVDDRSHTSATAIPSTIWVPEMPVERSQLEAWLRERRGGPVRFTVPQRGDKASLARTVTLNAEQELARHKLARSGDITVRSQALEELRDALGLDRAPLRIECYDVSHTQGTHQVASMVVFEDAMPKKADYRHFIVRGPDGNGASDDTAAMDEVLRRRLTRLLSGAPADDAGGDEDELSAESRRRFAYRPDLIVVDGGLPQVHAAQRVVDEMGADVRIVGLAKRLEEVWIPGDDFPVIFPRQSAALRLLQHLRDESHRFAITFHRKKRGQAMTRSQLDAIEGLGPAKQKALLAALGSVAKIRAASVAELEAVQGIGPKLAQAIAEHFGQAAEETRMNVVARDEPSGGASD